MPDGSDEQQLATWLKDARERAGLSTYELAQRLGITQSRASRLERGLASVTPEVVKAWAEATGTSATMTAALVGESQRGGGTRKVRGNTTVSSRGLARRQLDAAEIREAVISFSEFTLTAIPDLLQVPGYATSILDRSSHGSGASAIKAAVAQRMNNQSILYDEARAFDFVIAESALRYHAGPKPVMAAQAHKIETVLTLPNVSVSVLPFAASRNLIVRSGFAIYEIPDEPIVLVELLAGDVTFAALPDVQLYRDAFSELKAAAVTGRDAAELIREAQTAAQ